MNRFHIVTPIVLIICASSGLHGQTNLPELFWSDTAKVSSQNWDWALYQQDCETYQKYKSELDVYPFTVSAFPVKEYEYAVHSESKVFNEQGHTFQKISIGDYPDFNSDTTRIAGSLIFLIDSLKTNENTFVQSRNWPYLTAQGTFEIQASNFDWFFMESPDHQGFFVVNMKLFDFKNGRNVLIIPHEDGSFRYDQYE